MTQPKIAPFWSDAFRPFFLLASLVAAVAVLVWIAYQAGHGVRFVYFDPITWHAHEMVFGYGLAIIGAFLLTAAKNWTNRPPFGGWKLQLLVGLWLAGRLAPLMLGGAPWLWALIDLAVAPLFVVMLSPYLLGKGQKQNRIFLGLLAALFCANLLVHLDALRVTSGLTQRGLWLGLDVMVIVIVIMAGRTVPFFIQRGIPGGATVHPLPWVETASLACTVLFAATDFIWPRHAVTAAIAFITAAVLFVRWVGWRPTQGMRYRLLWIIFAGYLWLVVGFALRGLAVLGMASPGLALHAVAVGTIGLVTYAMISRIGLGHTGRAIQVSNALLAGYVLITGAALARVALPMVAPAYYAIGVQLGGLLWAGAFLLFAALYAPLFWRPRASG